MNTHEVLLNLIIRLEAENISLREQLTKVMQQAKGDEARRNAPKEADAE